MTLDEYNKLGTKSRIGINKPIIDVEEVNVIQGYKYLSEPIKRLTRTNSFMILDEVFYIVKKDCDGKASRLYHVYRVSDGILVCPSTLDKEETVKMVMEKYIELDI